MNFLGILQTLLLGIVEGITEWLPVSSTGHMILFNHFYPSQFSDQFSDMFEYVIQLAAILAVVVTFWNKIFPFRLRKAEPDAETDLATAPDAVKNKPKTKLVADVGILKLWLKVVVASLPALLALLIDKLFEGIGATTESLIIACALIFYGVAFILVENRVKTDAKIKEVSEISYKYAFFIGCFQLLAAIPGTSRSGVTIIGALLLGVSRVAATEFTFYLAIPAMVGASGYKLLKFFLAQGAMSAPELGYLLIGSVVAFAVSLAAIRLLTDFVKKHNFKPFGWYRIVLGAIVIGALVAPTFF